MHLRKHDLLQLNDEWLKRRPAERLLEVSKRLLDDVKELHDWLHKNPDNRLASAHQSGTLGERQQGEVDQDSAPEIDTEEAAAEQPRKMRPNQ